MMMLGGDEKREEKGTANLWLAEGEIAIESLRNNSIQIFQRLLFFNLYNELDPCLFLWQCFCDRALEGENSRDYRK